MRKPVRKVGSGHVDPKDLPKEMEILLASARWPQRESDRILIAELSTRPPDWERVLILAKHHRLVPLTFHNLNNALREQRTVALHKVISSLRSLAESNAFEALKGLAEIQRILRPFEDKSIKVRVLKGLPLAYQVFGDISRRACGDIDLLITDDSVLEADRILRSLGYIPSFELSKLSPKRYRFYINHWKDMTYRNAHRGTEVDLHWRCFRNSRLSITAFCKERSTRRVSLGTLSVATLTYVENILFLCVHGTLDGWIFFKSLADVASQVRSLSESDLAELADAACKCRILPEFSATMILVKRYFSMDNWSEKILTQRNPTVCLILDYADGAARRNEFLATRSSIPISATIGFELRLRRNWSYRKEILLRILFRPRMWKVIPLPDVLFYLYPVLSPFEWLIHRAQRN